MRTKKAGRGKAHQIPDDVFRERVKAGATGGQITKEFKVPHWAVYAQAQRLNIKWPERTGTSKGLPPVYDMARRPAAKRAAVKVQRRVTPRAGSRLSHQQRTPMDLNKLADAFWSRLTTEEKLAVLKHAPAIVR